MAREKAGFSYDEKTADQFPEEMMRPGGLDLTKRILQLADLQPPQRILDLGCGTGRTVEYLGEQGYRAKGIDPSPTLIARALQRNPCLPLQEAAGWNLPFKDNTFDAVLAECSCSVMARLEEVLAEAYRVLKFQGKLLLSDVFTQKAGIDLTGFCGLGELFTKSHWDALLVKAGFYPVVWDDSSQSWKGLLAQLIWQDPDFLCGAGKIQGEQLKATGYFLAVAEKR